MDRDTLLRRAAKLAALAQGSANIAEAETAQAALAELLREHRLSMADVDSARMKDRIRAEERGTCCVRPPAWMAQLAAGIAMACDCKVIIATRLEASFRFIGEEGDAAVCAYWYEVMARTLPEIAARNRGALEHAHAMRALEYRRRIMDWRSVRSSFLLGAADRIAVRLRALMREDNPEAAAAGRELAVVKGAAVEAWIAREVPELGPARKVRPSVSAESYAAGFRAAGAVPLARGVETTAAPRPMLGGG
ncbi:MAG: hypothetical protein RLZZ127_1996 [Planctomycetota bacterium]|jgi:hypothetical protein